MKLEIKDIIDKHKDTPAIVIGHGPSLNLLKPQLQELKNKGFIIFDCNDWYYYHDLVPDYWVLATNALTIENSLDKMNKTNTPILFSRISDPTKLEFVEQNLTCDFLPYHQYPSDCIYGSASEGMGLSIQQELQKYTSLDKKYGIGVCVGVHVIAFSILMGCNPIYLTGMDVDYNLGWANNTNPDQEKFYQAVFRDSAQLDPYKQAVMDDLIILNESAKKRNTTIFNLNPKSCYSIFENKTI